MVWRNTHLQVIRQKSTQHPANLPLQTCDKNQWAFLLGDMGVGFNFRNNFANLGSFAKVSVPLQSTIPCRELSLLLYPFGSCCETFRLLYPLSWDTCEVVKVV